MGVPTAIGWHGVRWLELLMHLPHFGCATDLGQALEPFAKIVKSIEVSRLVVDGEHCVALMNIDTLFGPIAFAEYIRVVDGQIVYVRGYYDPRPIVNAHSAAPSPTASA